MSNKLGTAICSLRKSKNITQKDLADVLNISDKSISRWECGTSRPDLEMMYRISSYFGIAYQSLIEAHLSDKHDDDKIVENIIKEFSDMNKKKAKIIKISLIVSIIIIIVLIIGFAFSKSYNRFKVYKVYGESKDINLISGIYVETKIRDVLQINNIEIKDITIKESDIISVDLLIIENNEEKIIQNYSELKEIYFVLSEGFVEIDNLSDFFDKTYLRISITDELGNTEIYESKLEFVLDFSNNKIYYNDNFLIEEYNYELTDYSKVNVSEILLKNGFEENNNGSLIKLNKNNIINYMKDSNIITYSYESNNLRYRYKYKLNSNILFVTIYDSNLTTIQKYEFDMKKNKMNCEVGSCSGYEEVMHILEEKVLYLLK